MRCLRFSSMLLLGALCAPSQDLKEFEKRVTEFTLPNGLHFVLLERHEAPIVSFHTFVNAGSADDPAGQTGMARMIERVAFKGTETIGTSNWAAEKKSLDAVEEAWDRVEAEANKGAKTDSTRVDMVRSQARLAAESAKRFGQPGEYTRILDENGATNRIASTTVDATSYSYTLPSNRIELWFLMESQRLLHPVFRDFYVERDAQAAEYQPQLQSNPQNKFFAELLAAAFKVHPYRNPILGWTGDIQNLRRNAAKEFFDRYYTPGNISIAMVGDLNPVEAKKMAERYFGPMPAKPSPPLVHADEPVQEGPRTVVLEAPGPTLLAVGYKRPSQDDKDDLVFDIIQFLMSQGNTGLLYREMVQEKHLAIQARAGATFPAGRFPNLMVFVLVPAQGRTLEEAQFGLDDFLNRFKNMEIDAQSLARAKAQLRIILLRRLAASDGMASLLAIHQGQYGDWRKMFTAVAELDKVTPDAIQRVATKYLVATGRTTVYTVQPGQSNLVSPVRQPAPRKTGGAQ
ncbi:MAG: peptidase domain protein [Candidatus Solibacter sp.]|nr:peptidase domain protein [Candidatus Solibacter sp.]